MHFMRPWTTTYLNLEGESMGVQSVKVPQNKPLLSMLERSGAAPIGPQRHPTKATKSAKSQKHIHSSILQVLSFQTLQ